MYRNLSVRFLHIDQSADLVGLIDEDSRKLQNHHPQVMGCDVVVEKPHRRHHKGNKVSAKISVAIPGKLFVSSKEAEGLDDADSASVAITKAFGTVEHLVGSYL